MGYGGGPCGAARRRRARRRPGWVRVGLWQARIPQPRVRCDIGLEAPAAGALSRAVRRGRRSAAGPLDAALLRSLPRSEIGPSWTRFVARWTAGAERRGLAF